ncbi:hypothetical protein EGW08_001022, partial [Elysia chlorotica]
MSKDEKKASPSPAGHGAMPTFDPAHLLGLHSLAAAGGGLSFPHLGPLSSPYGLLGQPAAFPGLFAGLGGLGGLGGLPNPLHAAAIQHSLAAASYYGLNKLPGEMGSSPPTSSPRPASSATPPSGGGGRSSRSSSSKRASSPSPSSSHRHAASRSSSSPSASLPPSSSPSALSAAYGHMIPGWPGINGAGFPFAYPAAMTSDPRHTASSGSSGSSRRSRKPGAGGGSSSTGGSDHRNSNNSGERADRDRRAASSSSSRKSPPAAHQNSSSSSSSSTYLSIPSAHHHHQATSSTSSASSSSAAQSKTATSSSSKRTSSSSSSSKPSASPSTDHTQAGLHYQQQHQHHQAAAAAAAAAATYGGLDPRGLISPYQMSPELLYLSQSLFLQQQQHQHHQQQLHSPFLAAAAAAAAAEAAASSSSTYPSSTASSSALSSLAAAKKPAAVTTATSATSTRVSSSSSLQSSLSSGANLEPGQISRGRGDTRHHRRRQDASPDQTAYQGKTLESDAAINGAFSSTSGRHSRQEEVDDRLLVDLSAASHFMDDQKRRKIADSIRRRVGGEGGDTDDDGIGRDSRLPSHGQNSVAALLSRHGIQHSDWLAHQAGERPSPSPAHDHRGGGTGSERRRRVRDNHSPQQTSGRKSRESEISDKIRLEAELERQEEQLRELQRRYSSSSGPSGQQNSTSETSLDLSAGQSAIPYDLESVTSQRSRSRLDTTSSLSDDQLLDGDGQTLSGSDSNPSSPETSRQDGEDSSNEDGSPKKKAQQIDERELTIPLEHGWNRQTIINGMGRRGIVGEVLYFAPCGKKLKTIPDVMRYLERNPNSDLGRENFSFNTKANVGHFFEVRNGQGSTPVPLTDTEILEKIEMSRGKRARMQMLARRKREKAQREHALARQVMEGKLKRRMELQVMEKRKEKEQVRMEKQQEKQRLQENLRRERESRAQQIIEARNRRQRELEELRIAEAM